MGTRSLIGRQKPDGVVDYAYCYMDGSPEWNGVLLASAPDQKGFTQRLIAAGEIDHIERDRTVVIVPQARPARRAANPEDYVNRATRDSDAEWCYLLRQGAWLVAYTLTDEDYRPLTGLDTVLLEREKEGKASVLTQAPG